MQTQKCNSRVICFQLGDARWGTFGFPRAVQALKPLRSSQHIWCFTNCGFVWIWFFFYICLCILWTWISACKGGSPFDRQHAAFCRCLGDCFLKRYCRLGFLYRMGMIKSSSIWFSKAILHKSQNRSFVPRASWNHWVPEWFPGIGHQIDKSFRHWVGPFRTKEML